MTMKRTISFILAILLSLTAVQVSAMASSSITSAAYADGIVSVRGTGFTAGTTYLVRVVDTASSSIQALGNVTAAADGTISKTITTGALTNSSPYVVKINDPAGHLAASAQVTDAATDTTPTTPTTPFIPTPQATSTIGTTGTITVRATVDPGGKAAATVTEAELAEAIKKAQAAGTKAGDVRVEISIIAGSAREVSLALTKASIIELVNSKLDTLSIHTGAVTLSLDKRTLDAMKNALAGEAASGILMISIAAVDKDAALQKYSEAAKKRYKEKIGDRPVYDFTMTAGDQKVIDFKGGTVDVSVAYEGQASENPNAVIIYYVDEQGNLKIVNQSSYNPVTKAVSFKIKHFSSYAIGYNAKRFADVANGTWFSDAVAFAASRGITEGIDANHFAPGNQITRADFLIMVMKAYGLEANSSLPDNFVDAGNKYYTSYLGAAKKLGLVSGTGDNRFEPEKSITRQDMFVILYHVLDSLGELPPVMPEGAPAGIALTDYKDWNQVAAYAAKAMKLFVETGIVSGSNGSLMPKGTATRAETVQVLYQLMKR